MNGPDDFFAALRSAESLFDVLPDVVFFIKDTAGRYVRVNQTLADRCAGGDKAKLIGRTPAEVFPASLAASYARQDKQVLSSGRSVEHQLELHIYPGRKAGWCLTTKRPVNDDRGRIIGITGISRDLNAPGENAPGFSELAAALRMIQEHHAESLRIEDIAAASGMSVYQLEQRVRRLFQMSPLQLIHKLRLDEATRLLLETDTSLADIAISTGWCDQSAFTRHFSRYAGMAPGRFRALHQRRKEHAWPRANAWR
jgi:PAS domain S-box-containing protein